MDDPKRARSWKRRIRPRINLTSDAPVLYSTLSLSFFSSLKNELVHHRSFKNRDEARMAIFEYIEVFYNRQRRHQSLDYVSPIDYERSRAVA